MGIPLYLAMTAYDFQNCVSLPPYIAWLSCLLSPFGTGLTNLPQKLPKDSLLILTDRIPLWDHDPVLIAKTLGDIVEEFSCRGVLLDFQRPGYPMAEVIRAVSTLPCPVCVSSIYDTGSGPVFLPAPPSDLPLPEYLKPWNGRDIWLEVAPGQESITVSDSGAKRSTIPPNTQPTGRFRDEQLHCHYDIRLDDAVEFHLFRTTEDLSELLAEGEALGVTYGVGLYQEMEKTAPGEPERSCTSLQEGY